MTPPPNAPEAGSNGEREAIATALVQRRMGFLWRNASDVVWHSARDDADAVLAAGFTRAHHDGETITDGLQVAHVRAIIRERDALAAKLAEAKAAEDVAYRSRNEAQERANTATRRLYDSDKREPALAEALSLIADLRLPGVSNGPLMDAALALPRVRALVRAALAGNGNGTGEGDGWIAVATRPREIGRYIVHLSDGTIQSAWYDGEERLRWLDGDIALDVTHWRPLPAPPSAGETRTT